MRGSRLASAAVAACLIGAMLAPVAAQSNTQSVRYGEVVSVEATVVTVKPKSSGQVGATVGAVAGYALADRGDRWLGGLLGGVIGGAAGRASSARKKKGWQLIVRVEKTGEEIGVQVVGKKQKYNPGDRVRMLSSGGQTQVSPAPR